MQSPQLAVGVITLFPEAVTAFAQIGVLGRAIDNDIAGLQCWNPRDFTTDKHRTVDDRPYGGGPGMVMKPGPLEATIGTARQALPNAQVVYLSPQGQPLTQALVAELASQPELILLAGRYEGIDERLLETAVHREVSIGDYVLSGGELPALVLLDAMVRLLPGALGHKDSASEDSFATGLLDHPHYTRPECYQNQAIPAVLKSGDHGRIERWRAEQALLRTWQRRPDLLTALELNPEQQRLLKQWQADGPPKLEP